MENTRKPKVKSALSAVLPVSFLALIISVIVPIPEFLLDVFLVLNIGLSVLIFLQSWYTKTVLEFDILPTVIIYTAATRLALNIASSRLILGKAKAGKLISAVGEFTIGGSYILGITIYIMIVILMIMVVNKGTERIGEVTARFSLDSMGGRQMAIDADLSAGHIDAEEARKRREALQREMKFFGAMDGAVKYIKGDAMAGLVITIINIVVGLVFGIVVHQMSAADAANTYAKLTIGDGIVNQIPAMLVAFATSTFITRGTNDGSTTQQFKVQFFKYYETLRITSFVMFALAAISLIGIIPNMPTTVFIAFGGLLMYLSILGKKKGEDDEMEQALSMEGQKPETEDAKKIDLYVDRISVEVGLHLTKLVYDEKTGDMDQNLRESIANFRKEFKNNYGVTLPPIRLKYSDAVDNGSYIIKVRGAQVSSMKIKSNCKFMLMYGDDISGFDFGEYCELPQINAAGYWVSEENEDLAREMGGKSFGFTELLIPHLEKAILEHIDMIITRQMVKEFKEQVQEYNKAVIDDLENAKVTNNVIQKVVKNLLIEGIPIKDFEYILENISDNPTTDPDMISEMIRSKMPEIIVEKKVDGGVLKVISFQSETEKSLKKFFTNQIDLDTHMKITNLTMRIADTNRKLLTKGDKFVFAIDSPYRLPLFRQVLKSGNNISIISYDEIPRGMPFETIMEL